ncbi:MAG: glycosyltransferase [Ferruginibacter sp.]
MNSNDKTLIILSPGFPKDEADTTCLPFLQTFVRSLGHADPTLKIIVLAFQYPFVSKEYVWENVTVIAFNGRNRGKLHRLLLWARVWRRIKKLLQQNNVIGFFNLWLGECALMGKHAAKKSGLPSFTWILGQDAKANNNYIIRIKPNPRSLIAMSDFLADSFEINFKIRPQHVIPLGIDKRLFPPMLAERPIDILGAGSLIPLKQYEVFIQMIVKLAVKRRGIKAVIVGEGNERERLQKMIDENSAGSNIELAGEKNHATVLSMMQQSKIFLHPSNYEGFSGVCSEALYAGVKVVSYTRAMKKDFKNWFVVETEMQMLKQLEDLLDYPNPEYERVLVNDSEETGRAVLALYTS